VVYLINACKNIESFNLLFDTTDNQNILALSNSLKNHRSLEMIGINSHQLKPGFVASFIEFLKDHQVPNFKNLLLSVDELSEQDYKQLSNISHKIFINVNVTKLKKELPELYTDNDARNELLLSSDNTNSFKL